MIKTIIVDDEPWAIELMSSYLNKIDGVTFVSCFDRSMDALQFLETNRIDLIFLDIQMPELTGLQFLNLLNERAQVIITSAFPDFALKGYEHNVVDYLLKPIEFERLYKAVQKIIRPKNADLTAERNTVAERDYLFLKADGKMIKVKFNDVVYIEALRDYLSVQTVTEKLITLDSLKNFETILPHDSFLRIHKSYIINISSIDAVEKNHIYVGDKVLPIGATFRNSVFYKLGLI